jgi:hypothetical protein
MRPEPKALISPHFPAEKLEDPTLDDLIDVFEDRVKYWLLEPAKKLMEGPPAEVAGFALSLSYFEGIWIFISGRDSRSHSQEFFRRAFIDVFKTSNLTEALAGHVADVLYQDGRCGFYHDGMARHRIYFSKNYSAPLGVTLPMKDGVIDETGTIASIVVDPPAYMLYVDGHFKKYVSRLRDPTETDLRRNFEQACRDKWDFEGEPVLIALD